MHGRGTSIVRLVELQQLFSSKPATCLPTRIQTLALNVSKESHFTFWALDEDRRFLTPEAFSNSQRGEAFHFNLWTVFWA